MIKRQKYLEILNQYKDKPFIKVLTGLRRVGKSTLLNMYVDELKSQGVDESHILKINFELPESFEITDYQILTNHVLNFSKGKHNTIYLLLDEIGRVKDWEKAINGFHAMGTFDLYITGSNADMLSSELSTYLAGRYIELLIHPFSFKEFIELNKHATFQDYLIYGGIPSIQSFNLQYDFSMNALRDSFRSAILQDVITRHQIRNAFILEKLIQYVFTNVGKTFSALSISKYFKSQRINVSVDSILSYLRLIQDAFLIYKVSRNDLVGKNILKTEEKYYISDHGIREAISGNNMAVIESVLENIVYIELLRRGYKVYIGKVDIYEVDFVAYKGKEVCYYQVTYLMELESTRDREFGVYKRINDNFPKYVISMDQVDFSRDGIVHMHIEDFLLNG
ncbi:MAG: ATP-binding protein [Candidatus Izemoplasmatales bacterium]|jgi:predicted AAA+ superfamily ATPase|nr:ATP-binding protein [Candidatus Izemoplasmatales bacterium]